MKQKFYKSDGTFLEEKELDFPMLEADKGVEALRSYIVAFQGNQRLGTACAKKRGEVSGTGKKPYRQKGTGRARHGSRRSPLFAGGGVAHGPRPRDYTTKINKKVKRLALHRAIQNSFMERPVGVIEMFDVKEVRTKIFHDILLRVNDDYSTMLLVDVVFADNILLSGRNIPWIGFSELDSLNPYDLLSYDRLLFSQEALTQFLSRFNSVEI